MENGEVNLVNGIYQINIGDELFITRENNFSISKIHIDTEKNKLRYECTSMNEFGTKLFYEYVDAIKYIYDRLLKYIDSLGGDTIEYVTWSPVIKLLESEYKKITNKNIWR